MSNPEKVTFNMYRNPQGEVYPRPVGNRNLSNEQFIKQMIETSKIDEGHIRSVMNLMARCLKSNLQQGNTVVINGVGLFGATMSLVEKKQWLGAPKRKLTPEEIVLYSQYCRFESYFCKPDKNVVYSLKTAEVDFTLQKKEDRKDINAPRFSKEERKNKAIDFLKTHDEMSFKLYRALAGIISKSLASNDLKSFLKEGWLDYRTVGNAKFYFLKSKDEVVDI